VDGNERTALMCARVLSSIPGASTNLFVSGSRLAALLSELATSGTKLVGSDTVNGLA
jgi:hypothetical protein